MRAVFWFLVLFGLAVGLAVAARYNEGYALLVLPPYRVQLSLNLLIAALLVAFVLFYILLRMIGHTLRLPMAVHAFRERRKRDKAARALRDAVRFLFEGRYGHAVASATQAHAGAEAPGLAALIAARAARAMRDDKQEREWLERAAVEDKDVRTARLMTAAELHYDARRFDLALDSLEQLQKGGQRHIAALRLALRTGQALGRWTEVLRLARQLEKHRALSPEVAASLRYRAHQESIRNLREDPAGLLAYWRQQPEAERRDARLAGAAARALIAAGEADGAQRIIEEQLKGEWSTELAQLYAECRGGDLLGRIAHAEDWLKSQPRDAGLLLALGRLCLQQQLWGKAQSYLEASIAVAPSRTAHIELAELLDQLGRGEQADTHYRAAARMA